jgi:hypothetical protein
MPQGKRSDLTKIKHVNYINISSQHVILTVKGLRSLSQIITPMDNRLFRLPWNYHTRVCVEFLTWRSFHQ